MSEHEKSNHLALEKVFASLWSDYIAFNPQAKRIYDCFLSREQVQNANVRVLKNDHIALRTFNLNPIGLKSLSAIFQKLGYRECGEYFFTEKKLYARHLEHLDSRFPKIFISELEVEKFSGELQQMCREVASAIVPSRAESPDLLWSGRSWRASHQRYLELLKESEYAAWVYAFGFRSNHFTILVNALESFKDLPELNEFVKQSGFALNTSGGEIKGSRHDCLEQSSTLAERARVTFEEGEFEIPACYYEFAIRHQMPDGKLYQGFVAASADKIFESTNVKSKSEH